MALSDLFTNVQLLLRWVHIFAGIVWIGHLYFFNFVNIPFQGTIGPDVKRVVNPQPQHSFHYYANGYNLYVWPATNVKKIWEEVQGSFNFDKSEVKAYREKATNWAKKMKDS